MYSHYFHVCLCECRWWCASRPVTLLSGGSARPRESARVCRGSRDLRVTSILPTSIEYQADQFFFRPPLPLFKFLKLEAIILYGIIEVDSNTDRLSFLFYTHQHISQNRFYFNPLTKCYQSEKVMQCCYLIFKLL